MSDIQKKQDAVLLSYDPEYDCITIQISEEECLVYGRESLLREVMDLIYNGMPRTFKDPEDNEEYEVVALTPPSEPED